MIVLHCWLTSRLHNTELGTTSRYLSWLEQVALWVTWLYRSGTEDRSSRQVAESAAATASVPPRPLRQSVGRSELQ